MPPECTNAFAELTPDAVILAAEAALQQPFGALTTPLASYVNRVYELETARRERVIAKFYRPGRWSKAALEEEHALMAACVEAELPVIAPLTLPGAGGKTLFESDSGIFAAFYPRRSGRRFEPETEEDWLRLGQLIGRLHCASEAVPAQHRVEMTPTGATRQALRRLAKLAATPAARRWLDTAERLTAMIEPEFEGVELSVCHGDCHAGNVLVTGDGRLMLIDFDDACRAPAIQDLWLLMPDTMNGSTAELEWMLEGYRDFALLPERQKRLVEPLRAMRMIYFLDWCAMQRRDFNFEETHPGWGSEAFWRNEEETLLRQQGEIEEALSV